ncbi:MAG TPA: ATP-binding cassette domain-containing protein [Chthoniobacterales bacterium]|jgi:ABC-2 type transport system ATP-binding protein|nr:ATP-binding cassette domain-containing protein [Chthoniobacterales bacterium]
MISYQTTAERENSSGTAVPAIVMDKVSKRYGSKVALDNVSFRVQAGEVFGLLGPNGAGKTTTIRILLSLCFPTQGRALVNGYDVTTQGVEVRRSVGWVPQDRSADLRLTAFQNLIFACGLYGVMGRAAAQRADELLAVVNLTADRGRRVKDFSGGMRRRLEIAMGLVNEPKVIFLDEPTLGLDIQTRYTIWNYVQSLRKRGSTVLLTTHYLEEADSLCDRIAIIDEGRIKALNTPLQLKRNFATGRIEIEVSLPPETRAELLAEQDLGLKPGQKEDVFLINGDDKIPRLTRFLGLLSAAGVVPTRIETREPSLDEVFLALAGRTIAQVEAE